MWTILNSQLKNKTVLNFAHDTFKYPYQLSSFPPNNTMKNCASRHYCYKYIKVYSHRARELALAMPLVERNTLISIGPFTPGNAARIAEGDAT